MSDTLVSKAIVRFDYSNVDADWAAKMAISFQMTLLEVEQLDLIGISGEVIGDLHKGDGLQIWVHFGSLDRMPEEAFREAIDDIIAEGQITGRLTFLDIQ